MMQQINEATNNYFPMEKQILAVSSANSDAHSKDQASPSASQLSSGLTTNANLFPQQAYFFAGVPANQRPNPSLKDASYQSNEGRPSQTPVLIKGESSGKLPNGKIKRVPSNSKLDKVRFKSALTPLQNSRKPQKQPIGAEAAESKSHSRDAGLTTRTNQFQPPQFLQGQQMTEMATN